MLTTHNLTIQKADKIICKDFNWQMHTGDCWGILGPNGSGKTTLLHTLTGLCAPTAGDIFLNAKKLSTLPRKQIAQKIGLLLQDTHIVFPQTVFEFCLAGRYPHLSLFAGETAEDYALTHSALKLMELTDFHERLIATLSGGERRRLALATLLTQAPEIYCLDEPTNHLDLRHQIKTLRHFKNLTYQSTGILMALHDINHVQQFCNKVLLLLGNGHILQGDTADILTEENLSMLYMQPVQRLEMHGKLVWITDIDLHEELK